MEWCKQLPLNLMQRLVLFVLVLATTKEVQGGKSEKKNKHELAIQNSESSRLVE